MMKVDDLKAACKLAGLVITGKKSELISRLKGSSGDSKKEDTSSVGAETSETEKKSEDEKSGVISAEVVSPKNTDKTVEQKKSRVVITTDSAAPKKTVAVVGEQTAKVGKVVEIKEKVKTAEAQATAASLKSSDEERKKRRLERFGEEGGDDAEKKRQRAERFNILTPDIEAEKRRVRAEKFGVVTKETEELKKKARALKFGTETEEEKKAKRAARFIDGAGGGGGGDSRLDMALSKEKTNREQNGSEWLTKKRKWRLDWRNLDP